MRLVTALTLFAAGVALMLGSAQPAASTQPSQITGGVIVPYYGAAYGGSGGVSSADAKRMVELLESIDKRLESIEAKTAPAGFAKPAAKLDLLATAKAKCLNCHTQAKADAKGGGFILFSDEAGSGLKPLNAGEKVRVKQAVQSGAMPPNVKLTPAEKSAFD